ncbi:MAG: DUF5462 family protein [Plesiomonas shigelloides]
MKKTALLSLLIALLSSHSTTSLAESNNKTIQLGTVNGRVINEQTIEINKALSDPVLFLAKQESLSKKLTRLDINNAKIITKDERNIIIYVKDETKNIQARLTIELLVDGKKTQIQGRTIGSDVSISVPDNVKLVELRTLGPIFLLVPRSYRGDFKFALDITGWST